MHELTLRGTPTQMGTAHGALMAQNELQLPQLAPDMVKLAAECAEVTNQYAPEFIEEMRAFAEAARVPYDTLKTFTLTIPLQQTMPSCSVVAVMPERSADGKLMVGRNYDFAYNISWDDATTFHTYPEQGYAHTGNSDIWIGREDGLNEAGLFVAMSATFIPGVKAGLPFWFIVRGLLERCATVEEAVALIQSMPHAQSRNYMLADATRAIVAEASIDGVYIHEPEDGILVMTNHPAHPELKGRGFAPEDSPVRYKRLRTLSTDGVTQDDMQIALNDRENHVCAHFNVDGQPFGTIWSMIAWPERRQLAIARGTGDNEGTMTYRSYEAACSKSAPSPN